MEHRATHLVSHCINYRRLCLLCFLFLFSILTAEATEYTVSPFPSDKFGESVAGEDVQIVEDTVIPYWQFLLWLAAMQILSIIDVILYFTKLIFVVLGFKIIDTENVLDNSNRSSIYTYIKTKPGACIGEIVEKTGLGRGKVRHHITILEVQNKIEVHNDGGKIRYFENNSTYDEEEIKIISALQNITNQRIVSEIQNGKCNTNSALAHEIGVSRATISWYMRTLKEVELINEERKGKNIIYRINPSYENLIEKYG
ncbi:transcriptional regulator [Methanosarcina sp. A14]|uniref:Transcriptional regulator, ArsR family n=2 Tax=Methanosarcina barkeri TaxID=2208 RepID=A0A0E3QU23_METBA|nr:MULTISPECIES: winged helix-turn-helix transcriptional regulator [Methanosarcina]AKB54124.1 Transcriptional regulator, ArsR family [Methanosarcina barkeri MS]AKB57802.1 Transcriptional regulator, ArsR family [Methanosarcina barkeri 227]OED10330.1 transcriptional regulator [Methanosarcina sp. A14]